MTRPLILSLATAYSGSGLRLPGLKPFLWLHTILIKGWIWTLFNKPAFLCTRTIFLFSGSNKQTTFWKPTFCGLTKRRLKSQSFCCWMQFVCTKIKACLGSAVPNLLIIKPRPVWLAENRSSNPRALYMHSCWWRRRSEWSLPPLQWNPASLCLSSNSFLHPAILSRHSDRRLVVMLHTSEAFVSLKLRFTYKLKRGKAKLLEKWRKIRFVWFLYEFEVVYWAYLSKMEQTTSFPRQVFFTRRLIRSKAMALWDTSPTDLALFGALFFHLRKF